jgi:hypothetical protein
MQFRPVGLERPGEEVTPEGAEFSEGFCRRAAARDRGGQGSRTDRCHDAASAFFIRGFSAKSAVFGAEDEFSPDLLKDGFNCRDSQHIWFRPRIHRGERMENAGLRLRFRGCAATSAAANFR